MTCTIVLKEQGAVHMQKRSIITSVYSENNSEGFQSLFSNIQFFFLGSLHEEAGEQGCVPCPFNDSTREFFTCLLNRPF